MKVSLLINMKMPTIVGSFIIKAEKISCSAEMSMKQKFYNLGAWSVFRYMYGVLSELFHLAHRST